MKIRTLLLGAVVAAGAITALASPASAYISCNRDGDCWHTENNHYRAPGVRFNYHPDDWYFHRHWNADRYDGERYHYRDYHEGRGYYRGGVWIGL